VKYDKINPSIIKGVVKMSAGKIVLIIIGILVVIGIIIGGSLIGTYNGLVTQSKAADSAWAQVENNLQRRFDLIPNLVSTVKGYAKHENEIFTNIANARAKLAGAQTQDQKVAASGELSSALSRLLMVQENYPQLKADAQFKTLSDELAGTENRLAVARKDYNDIVTAYNIKISTFPTNMFAGAFGFKEKKLFEIQSEARNNVKVEF
jgi:LemA protein